ncbi:hypothetical protein NECAME_14110 [Necator americanus]|uniref:Uncharacterized protein n=1 Tax=Necator americanus TaxID=51031 RepID=W2SSG5_NECAM|nr:hypothetical protein NECAME_14110 [Necator americanus]ETN71751.1 hypothetical protein NECAME_14110 [Necator americanus]
MHCCILKRVLIFKYFDGKPSLEIDNQKVHAALLSVAASLEITRFCTIESIRRSKDLVAEHDRSGRERPVSLTTMSNFTEGSREDLQGPSVYDLPNVTLNGHQADFDAEIFRSFFPMETRPVIKGRAEMAVVFTVAENSVVWFDDDISARTFDRFQTHDVQMRRELARIDTD